jgi:hypothetical protein
MPELVTGDPHLAMVLDAGPRMLRPDTPSHVREAIASSPSLHWFKIELARREVHEREKMLAEIRQIGRENREIEYKATNGLGMPYCRIPLSVMEQGKKMFGDDCWQDEKFMEDFLEAYPECRIKVTRGTRGQEYGGNG